MLGASLVASAASDLIPTAVRFKERVVDDVTGARAIVIHAKVKNIGSNPVKGLSAGLVVGSHWKKASVYGPKSGGGYYLGRAIEPGETGLLSMRVPVDSLNHCQKVKVIIDTARTLQKGGAYIFRNDSGFFKAREYGNYQVCLIDAPFKP